MRRHSRSGFTLFDPLLTIATIAVLAAIVLLVLAKAPTVSPSPTAANSRPRRRITNLITMGLACPSNRGDVTFGSCECVSLSPGVGATFGSGAKVA